MIKELKALQKELGVTQEELAMKLGLADSTISLYLSGKRKMGIAAQFKMNERICKLKDNNTLYNLQRLE